MMGHRSECREASSRPAAAVGREDWGLRELAALRYVLETESKGLLKDRIWVARERRMECDIPQSVFTYPLDPFRSKEMDTRRFSAHISGPLGIRFEPWVGCPEAAAFCPVSPGACVAAEPGVTHRDC